MSKRGKSINLFLMDGTASGRIKCTLANWTGLAYKIPRTELDKCKERNDLKQTGVYFLYGTSDETGENVVYVGQAGVRKSGEGILYRLQEHKRNSEKDYWTEAVVFTTSNNSFGPTEISYLENRFCNLAKEAKRYTVKNANDLTPGNDGGASGSQTYTVDIAELDPNIYPDDYPLIELNNFESAFEKLEEANMNAKLETYQDVADIFGIDGADYKNCEMDYNDTRYKYYDWYSDESLSILITFKAEGNQLEYFAYTTNGII